MTRRLHRTKSPGHRVPILREGLRRLPAVFCAAGQMVAALLLSSAAIAQPPPPPAAPVVTVSRSWYFEAAIVVVMVGLALYVVCRSSRRN